MTRNSTDPFDIPGIDYIETEDTAAMNAAVSDIIENLSADVPLSGSSLPACLIAQTASAIPELADWVAPKAPYGIKVCTYHGLVSGLWDVFGDTRAIANQVQIRNAARRSYVSSTGRQPTSDALDLATEMIDMCLAADDETVASTAQNPDMSLALSVPANMILLYERDLTEHSLIDPRRAAAIIAKMIASETIPSFSMIIEDPSEDDASLIRFVTTCSKLLDIRVIRRNANDLDLGARAENASSLFAVAYGSHVQGELAASCIREMMDAGATPEEISIAVTDTASAGSVFFDAFVEHGIPFECSYQVPAAATPLGRWFLSLMSLSRNPLYDADALSALTAVATSPYTGCDDTQLAVDVLTNAFGIVREDEADEPVEAPVAPAGSRLEELSAIITSKRHPVSWLAFASEEGRSPYTGEQQEEDTRIASAIHEYLDACEAVGDHANLDDLSQVPISLCRTYGNTPRIKIVPYARASYEPARFWVLASLDAASFPGYRPPGPFQSAMETLGMSPDPWQMKRAARFQVADVLRKSAAGGCVLLRSVTDAQGSPAPPAPILAEIAEHWGGMASNAFPETLPQDSRRSVSEAKTRKLLSKQASATRISHIGGTLDSTPLISSHVFSPTELELYWACPRKWLCSRNGMGYSDPPATDATDPRISGSIIHEAMSIYYRSYGKDHPRLSPDDPIASDALADAMSQAVENTAPWILEKGATPAEEYAIAQVQNRCRDLLEQDRTFLPGFTPSRFELGIPVKVAGIPLYGVIDRIDVGPKVDGKCQAVIVDYKGRATTEYGWQKKADEPGLHIQGLIYAEMVEAKYPKIDVVGIVYRGYADGSMRAISFVPLDADTPPDSDEQTYRDRRESFKQHLKDIASGIAAGDFSMRPRNMKKDACSYCNACNICPGEVRS